MFPGILIGLALMWLTRNGVGLALAAAVGTFDPDSRMLAEGIGMLAYPVACGFGFMALRQSLVGAAAAFWTSRLGRFLIGRVAGLAMLALLMKPASMAAGLCMWLAATVWVSLGGGLNATFVHGLVWLFYGVTFALAWICRRRAKITYGKASKPAARLLRTLAMSYGGSARIAGLREEWSRPWKPGRIMLGTSMYDPNWVVGIEDDRHHCVFGTTRSGKGRDCLIPNLLTWPGSAVNNDPKGQNCAVTAAAREAMGQTVAALDPTHMLDRIGLKHFRKQFNPLFGLDPDAPDYVERVNRRADAMMVREGRVNVFFDHSCKTGIAGGIDLEVKRQVPELRSLAAVRDMFTDPDGPPIAEMAAAGGLARAAAAMLSQGSEETVGNIMATILAQTAWLESPGVREMLSGSDFELSQLNDGNLSLYLIVPPQTDMRQFQRLFMALTLEACMERPKGEHATLFAMDEFYESVGRLEIMSRAMAIGAGFGVKLMPVLHNLSQLQELYPQNYQSFLANAGQIQVFATNDPDTAEYFSRKLGETVRWTKRKLKDGTVEWEPGRRNFVRDAVEFCLTTSRESGLQMVFTEGGDPFLLRRAHYDDVFPKGAYSPDPYEPDRTVTLRDVLARSKTAWREIRSWFGE
jgi:hypothetical protein